MTRAGVEVYNGSIRIGEASVDHSVTEGAIVLDAGTEIQMACYSADEPNTHLIIPLQSPLKITIVHQKTWNGMVELSILDSEENPWLILSCPHGTNRLFVIPDTMLMVHIIHHAIPEVTSHPDGSLFRNACH